MRSGRLKEHSASAQQHSQSAGKHSEQTSTLSFSSIYHVTLPEFVK